MGQNILNLGENVLTYTVHVGPDNVDITPCIVLNADVEISEHWGPPRAAISEYKTYSTARVEVYRDDELISSTDNGVRI